MSMQMLGACNKHAKTKVIYFAVVMNSQNKKFGPGIHIILEKAGGEPHGVTQLLVDSRVTIYGAQP